MMIWIDDQVDRLAQLSESLFPDLWEKDICIKMILVGDNYKTEEPDADRGAYVAKLHNGIINLFYQFCYERKGGEDLDEFYKRKENIIPDEPKNLSEKDSSCEMVVKTIEGFIKDRTSSDTIVVGVDVMLNAKKPETEKTLTDDILEKLAGISGITVFIYSHYGPDEHEDIKRFRDKYANIDFFREQILVRRDSNDQILFLRFFEEKKNGETAE
jgi:hypothetical protein